MCLQQCRTTEQNTVRYLYHDVERKNIVKRGLLSQLVDTVWHIVNNFTGGSDTGSIRTKKPVPQTTEDAAACGDNESCSSWQINGFCENAFYPLEFRKKWCGVLCELCTGV